MGFLDVHEKRVGCLLHPMQNAGRDMRDVSFYGRELCDGHFCPSYSYISRAEKLAMLEILDDWYLYGTCITDIDLVKEFFRLVSEAAGEMPRTFALWPYCPPGGVAALFRSQALLALPLRCGKPIREVQF